MFRRAKLQLAAIDPVLIAQALNRGMAIEGLTRDAATSSTTHATRTAPGAPGAAAP